MTQLLMSSVVQKGFQCVHGQCQFQSMSYSQSYAADGGGYQLAFRELCVWRHKVTRNSLIESCSGGHCGILGG
jgi:hypothetical protein